MIKSKYLDALSNFVAHGIKTVGDYDYVLLVDQTGQTIIQRIYTDSTEILYCKMPDTTFTTFAAVKTQIDAFWVNPASTDKVYGYIFQCD